MRLAKKSMLELILVSLLVTRLRSTEVVRSRGTVNFLFLVAITKADKFQNSMVVHWRELAVCYSTIKSVHVPSPIRTFICALTLGTRLIIKSVERLASRPARSQR